MAQAGIATAGEDPSGMIYNPATLAFGYGTELTGAIVGIHTTLQFDPNRGTGTTLLGSPIGGNNGGNAGATVAIPQLFLGADLLPGVRIGLASAVLYSGGTYWDSGWVGRYDRLNSQIVASALQPTITWQPTTWLSIGGGAIAQYAEVKATAAIDFGTIDQLLVGGAFGGTPGQSDGAVRATLNGWAFGYTIGAVIQPLAGTRIGISYRSALTHDLAGKSHYDLGPTGADVASVTGAFQTTQTTLRVPLPPGITFGLQQEIASGLTVLATVQWVDWARQKELRATYANPAQPTLIIPSDWHDTYFVALGVRYEATERIVLRAGIAYEQSPAPTAPSTLSFGDAIGNAAWFTVGMRYKVTPDFMIDAAAGHVSQHDRAIVLTSSAPDGALRGNVSGTIRGAGTTFLALQSTFRF